MFYSDKPERSLRFGDIVSGFPLTVPTVDDPRHPPEMHPFTLQVTPVQVATILSPCCSIRDRILLLAPLMPISPSFFQNPYWVEDFTRINRKMNAENTVAPHVWKQLPFEEKQKRFSLDEPAYAFSDFFIYDRHQYLPRYSVHKQGGHVETGYYMIDFKTVFRVNCGKVISPDRSPIDAKLLELTIGARADLRNKLVAFFARNADEGLT